MLQGYCDLGRPRIPSCHLNVDIYAVCGYLTFPLSFARFSLLFAIYVSTPLLFYAMQKISIKAGAIKRRLYLNIPWRLCSSPTDLALIFDTGK
jgi:hypothetical protein